MEGQKSERNSPHKESERGHSSPDGHSPHEHSTHHGKSHHHHHHHHEHQHPSHIHIPQLQHHHDLHHEQAKPNMLKALEDAYARGSTIKHVSDVEWDMRLKEWERERQSWMKQMVHNCIWAMGSPLAQAGGKEKEPNTAPSSVIEQPLTPEEIMQIIGERNLFGLDPTLLHGIESDTSTINIHAHQQQPPLQIAQVIPGVAGEQKQEQTKHGRHQPHPHHGRKGHHVVQIKHKKMTRLELLKFLADWDKASFGRRDMMLMEFLRTYRTKENIYDSDALFHCGGSLIFCRFSISLQMSFLKHRLVWHYFDALGIFVKSLQGDKYTEEFLRLGGLGFICEVIRVEVSGQADKLHACKFLVDMMKGRNSIAVKMFICDNPHFLESLVDSLTMCKDKKLVSYCGLCFENLCVEATISNVLIVTSYVMRLLPCDFNPVIQSMAFRVLQSVIRLKPSIAAKCVKPILDNLKTDDMDLLIEMSNLSLVILQTKSGPELIGQLMQVAEGIHLREQFKSVFRPHMRRARDKHSKDHAHDLRKAREKHERVKQKMSKFDHYMQQAGALFVINRMMTNKIEYVAEFTRQGVFGLSLKTLGSCPHWEVQGQGVTMVQFLHAMSVECAVSYFLMLPEKMLQLIFEKPAECLRYFTAPICVLLRKLGRFVLRLWDRWLEKVVIPAQQLSEEGVLPDYFINMCKMIRKVTEIQQQIAHLLEHPVMESHSKTPEHSSATSDVDEEEIDDRTLMKEFLTDDDEETCQYKTGKELLYKEKHFQVFNEFLDFRTELSEDKLDIKVDKSQQSLVLPGSIATQNELSAYEQTLLQDAENKTATKPSGDRVEGGLTKMGSMDGLEGGGHSPRGEDVD